MVAHTARERRATEEHITALQPFTASFRWLFHSGEHMSNVYSLQSIYFLSDILRKAKRVTTTAATATVIDDVLLLFRL